MHQSQSVAESKEQEVSRIAPRKTFHAPQLVEWGMLRTITQGPGNGDEDLDGTGSRPWGIEQP